MGCGQEWAYESRSSESEKTFQIRDAKSARFSHCAYSACCWGAGLFPKGRFLACLTPHNLLRQSRGLTEGIGVSTT